ncbi:zinc finger CCCH domain-containing protein 14-like protein [Tanacetum coccineum]
MSGGQPYLPSGRSGTLSFHLSFPDGSSPPAVKSRLCSKYNTAKGCWFGDTCHYAHGEWELGKPTVPLHHEDPRSMGPPNGSRFSGGPRMGFNPPQEIAPAGFGAFATTKISVMLASWIKRESEMVQRLIVSLTAAAGPHQQQKSFGKPGGGFGGPVRNFKTKLCENFTKGSCTFGDKCHFAHGAEELRSSGV